MKYIALLFCLVLFLVGCSSSSSQRVYENDGKIKVLSTTAMIDDLVGQIGGDLIDHIPLITGELDPHSYELIKGDDEKIVSSSIVFSNGLNLEHGASLRYLLEKHPHAVFLGNKIQESIPERILCVDGEIDPHVWMDISLWAVTIDPIVEALSKEIPESADIFHTRGESLRQKMLKTHRKIQTLLQEIPQEKRYLVTSHDAFNYFTRAYLAHEGDWEGRCIAPEGLAPEGQLSSLDIRRVIDHLSSYQIGVVFPESNVSRDSLRKIVSSCAHDVHISKKNLYGDAMGPAGSGADSYLGMIEHNAKALKEEWER